MVNDPKDGEDSNSHLVEIASPDHMSESDDFMTEFERNLQILIPDLNSDKDSIASKLPKGIRRS